MTKYLSPIALAVLIFTLLLFACSSEPEAIIPLPDPPAPPETPIVKSPVEQHGQLKVSGKDLLNANNESVVLRGVSFGWHNWWPRFYNAGSVQWLVSDWECSVVRAAMGVDPDNGYIQSPEWSEKLICDVVDAAIANGIYVIIDWHSHSIQLEEAKQFFKKMAEKYGDKPNVIYEIFNEPELQTWAEVKAYSEDVIATIRSVDPDNLILVGSPYWSQSVDEAANNPITGFQNLMYTLHFYAASHKQWLRDRADAAIKKGLPIFVSECAGMEASGDGPIDEAEWQRWVDWMEKEQVSWVCWSISDKAETCSMLKPSAMPNGKWSDNDLNEWGFTTRRFIKQYQTQP